MSPNVGVEVVANKYLLLDIALSAWLLPERTLRSTGLVVIRVASIVVLCVGGTGGSATGSGVASQAVLARGAHDSVTSSSLSLCQSPDGSDVMICTISGLVLQPVAPLLDTWKMCLEWYTTHA